MGKLMKRRRNGKLHEQDTHPKRRTCFKAERCYADKAKSNVLTAIQNPLYAMTISHYTPKGHKMFRIILALLLLTLPVISGCVTGESSIIETSEFPLNGDGIAISKSKISRKGKKEKDYDFIRIRKFDNEYLIDTTNSVMSEGFLKFEKLNIRFSHLSDDFYIVESTSPRNGTQYYQTLAKITKNEFTGYILSPDATTGKMPRNLKISELYRNTLSDPKDKAENIRKLFLYMQKMIGTNLISVSMDYNIYDYSDPNSKEAAEKFLKRNREEKILTKKAADRVKRLSLLKEIGAIEREKLINKQ
ncbi:hypothetical protein [uncultured Hoeflea sp.]|uniref:hypothetical protein n=1 Tax=uncultured Hoeflea sp. TaxID=538666 RepID=UPI0030DB7263|tara:strand:- start:2253 stop:3161 length:909 start_codon:yes stop_codon:yes gene_type:complete